MKKILAVFGKDVFFVLELGITEVDEKAVFFAGGTHVTKELCHVFVGEVFNCFEFDDEFVFDNEVHFESAEKKVIFVKDIKRLLLLDNDVLFGESMSKAVLINLFL